VQPAVIAAASPALDSRMQQDGRDAILVKRNVLIVDDSEGNRRLLRRMLQQLGCRVMEASDGDEVLAALTAAAAESADRSGRGVDVVLMDIEMARLGGIPAVRAMRKAGWRTPVIAVTGHAGADSAAECALALAFFVAASCCCRHCVWCCQRTDARRRYLAWF
jgi:CheY-like chemotaxis protein